MIEPTLKFDGGFLVVQSCDSDWANIGMFSGGKCAYYHVDVPSLVRQWRETKPGELSANYFDVVLQANGISVLNLIDALNRSE